MASKSLARIGNTSLRCCFRASIAYQASARRFTPRLSIASSPQWSASAIRSFHSSMVTRGILPHDENPPPKESEDSESPTVPTDISTTEYHKLADKYLGDLVAKLEAEQDKRQDLEVEYSAGVLEVSIANNIYVINKQPPNKQIWLASPDTGPKRFDWVVTGESMHQKEGAGTGDWIYLRDGSSLSEILRKEFGINIGTESGDPV